MSVEVQFSQTNDEVEFPYRAVSRAAVVSVILALLAAIGLFPTFMPMLGVSVVGVLAALMGMRAIKKYPREFSGAPVATIGIALNLLLLVGGSALHIYTYYTEVPDGYERVQFYQLQTPESEGDGPAEMAYKIDGDPVFLKGYIHPSSGSGMLRQFILVPDLGTCCFGGQPRSSDMIEVTLTGGKTVKAGLMRKKLAGTFQLNQRPMQVTDFDNTVFYRMKVDQIK